MADKYIALNGGRFMLHSPLFKRWEEWEYTGRNCEACQYFDLCQGESGDVTCGARFIRELTPDEAEELRPKRCDSCKNCSYRYHEASGRCCYLCRRDDDNIKVIEDPDEESCDKYVATRWKTCQHMFDQEYQWPRK